MPRVHGTHSNLCPEGKRGLVVCVWIAGCSGRSGCSWGRSGGGARVIHEGWMGQDGMRPSIGDLEWRPFQHYCGVTYVPVTRTLFITCPITSIQSQLQGGRIMRRNRAQRFLLMGTI